MKNIEGIFAQIVAPLVTGSITYSILKYVFPETIDFCTATTSLAIMVATAVALKVHNSTTDNSHTSN